MGQTGLVQTIPSGMKPGSDVANLSVMGYDPKKVLFGKKPARSPQHGHKNGGYRCRRKVNLVTLSGEEDYARKTMIDYSAGEITTKESNILMKAVQEALGNAEFSFYGGVSYRHCMIWKEGTVKTALTPPHDILGRKVADFLPSGEGGDKLLALMKASEKVLKEHPINQKG